MSYEAEKAVIGCLLIDGDRLNEIPFLKPEMFRSVISERFFAEIAKLCRAGVNPDIVTVRNQITVDEMPNEVFMREIRECADSVATSVGIASYAKIVLDDYRADELLKVLQNIHPDGKTVNGKLSELQSTIDRLARYTAERTESASDAVERYSPKKFTPNMQKPIRTRIKELDKIIGGIENGDMVIIAARPSVGKSAIATEMAINFAKDGKRCEMFNLEMRNEQTYDRMIAHESGIELSHIKWSTQFTGMEDKLFDEGNKALKELGDRLLLVDDAATVSEITARAKRDKAEIVIIDYAQLIRAESAYRDRTSQVGEISRSIKLAANGMNIPFIVLAQLNRASTLAKDNKPSMSELRESGAWEQDADKIILLWNKDESDRSVKGLLVDKNRHGEVGEAELKFDGAVMRFVGNGEFVEPTDEDDVPFDL